LHEAANEWTPSPAFKEAITRDALLYDIGGVAFFEGKVVTASSALSEKARTLYEKLCRDLGSAVAAVDRRCIFNGRSVPSLANYGRLERD
jgi:hypothetical protein